MGKFKFQKIDREHARFNDILALRYRIYCEQKGFEKPEDHPEGLERDNLDDHAIHYAAILKESDEVVGTIRLILKSKYGFPIENNFDLTTDTSHIEKNCIAEVSRLAITSKYCSGFWRKNSGQHCIPNKLQPNNEIDLAIGLIRCIAKESRELGITHWYAVMAKALYILLKKKRIVFSCIGPEKDYHGLRAPYFGAVEDILCRHEDLYKTFMKNCENEAA